MLKFFLLAFTVLSFACYATAQQHKTVAPAPKGTWQHLGTTTVGYKTDRDVITISGTDVFRKLIFKVKDAKIEILDMDVVFENEGHQDIPVRSVIERGGESRVIDLKGNSRRIKRISFVYRTVPGFSFEKAEVSVWGEK